MECALNLSDLIDSGMLQRMQDVFSRMTGIAVMTTDANGVTVIKGSHFSEFCKKCMRTPLGRAQCEQCNKQGAEMAMREGKSVAYTCHAGLLEFAAPIVVQGELLGCFIGGQVMLEKPRLDEMGNHAADIDMDREEYIEALEEIGIVTQDDLDGAIDVLYTLADILSDITFSRNLLFQANVELGKTVTMKSDFLANMSHEIRTPMNAVIGMAEMALREDLPVLARDYINQIKVAGKTLLAIINDILDFSKIESGKMDIIPTEYDPMALVRDVANMVITRLKDEEVELILDIAPEIPTRLYGDGIRIKQVILNLLNNAAKFTRRGKITFKLEYEFISEDEVVLYASVEDTGIGIKREDLGKLFQSFSQVDSKRNRNIEGTGLGLAISRQLLVLMNGAIHVESEYGKGSKFYFELPQKVMDATPSITVREPGSFYVVSLLSSPYLIEYFNKAMKRLGVEYKQLDSGVELCRIPSEKRLFCFIEQSVFTVPLEEFIRGHTEITALILAGFHSNIQYDIPNLFVLKKPIFVLKLAMIFNNEEMHIDSGESSEAIFDFIAPDANALIVDDNAVNLTVAEGLLEPLQMNIDTALSGEEAIGKISEKRYDLVFMDHMMPKMDGIETTHIIRRFYKEYEDVPIIALTANAVGGTRQMFCSEGMNDFIAKPIELRILISKVKQWLPPEKIQEVAQPLPQSDQAPGDQKIEQIADLDIEYALGILGSEKLFWTVLSEYYRVIDKKVELIRGLKESEDWTNYTIEVHALKSASRQIGAISLSEKAAAMEQAGNAGDLEAIGRCTDDMLEQYAGYKEALAPYCASEEEEPAAGEEISYEVQQQCFLEMRGALEELDMDRMEAVIREMEKYRYEGAKKELFARLRDAVDEVDVDACEEIMQEWENGEQDND